MEERRKDYLQLTDIKIELATTNANLKNIIEMFETHLADDKETLKRVNALETYKANLFGVCIGATAAGGFLGFLITISTKLMGTHP